MVERRFQALLEMLILVSSTWSCLLQIILRGRVIIFVKRKQNHQVRPLSRLPGRKLHKNDKIKSSLKVIFFFLYTF
jgi:hypothetical protein